MPPFLQSLLGRPGSGRQMAILVVGALVTALVFGVSRWATKPVMVPLYANVPLENVRPITDKLTELGYTYELDALGTTIAVPEANLVRVRVAMANEALPNAGRPGLELFDKPTWGMTDFTQKVNLRRALEGELERTIGKMRDVKGVQVHLALEEEQLFRKSDRHSKASVTLTMNGGGAPPQSTVAGIASLVASSVGGLEPEHVTVVDERGQALTLDGENSVSGLTSRQLAVQREIEKHLEDKALEILRPLVGDGNARVQVSALVNFDKVERTTQAVDPEKQATTTEQRAEVSPSTPQQGAGYSTSATSYDNSKSVESYVGAVGTLRKVTVAVLIADRSVAPATNAQPGATPTVTARTPDEVANFEKLVRTAVGIDSTRGDVISVISAPFDVAAPLPPADTLPTPDMLTRLQQDPKPVVAIGAFLVLLIVAVITLGALRPKKDKASATPALAAAPQYPELPASTVDLQAELERARQNAQMQAELERLQGQQEQERRQILLPPPPVSAEREQAIATVEQRPDAAVRVVRDWLRT